VGKDLLGDQAIAGFEKDGIDTELVMQSRDKPSGVALILVDEKGENSIAVAPGANQDLSCDHIEKSRDMFRSSSIALIQLEIPLETVETAARIASENGALVILNPAPACVLDDGLLETVDIITPNRTEAEILTGMGISNESSLKNASGILRGRGAGAVIITLGAEGAYISGTDYEGVVPGFKTEAVDTTAAGDTFNGALAVALSLGKPIAEAARFANAAAALSVGKMGAQPSIPRRDEIEEFMRVKGLML
jgi:ribokinase